MYKLVKNEQVIGYSNIFMNIPDTECIEIKDKEYEENERAKKRISELKDLLASTDYKALQFAEGELSAEKFEPIKQQRKKWREEINKWELLIK